MEVEKLVEVTRGELVESVHSGVVVVVDKNMKVVARVGNPGSLTFIRSAAKPIQAIPVVESGAAECFNLDNEDIALITASHSGEMEHIRIMNKIMEKISLPKEALQCGTHWPLNKKSAKDLIKQGNKPDVYHCTCSGKHAGMLVLCKYMGWDLDEYYLPDHPVQNMMCEAISDFAQVNKDEIIIAVDGCGVPVFALTIENMAKIYARFGADEGFSEQRKKACKRIKEAMVEYPFLVAGTKRLATDLMQATKGKVVAKDGAEGVFCAAVPSQGLGFACKISDGSSRALGPVVINVLDQMGMLTKDEKKALINHSKVLIKNYRGENIGEIRSAFSLT